MTITILARYENGDFLIEDTNPRHGFQCLSKEFVNEIQKSIDLIDIKIENQKKLKDVRLKMIDLYIKELENKKPNYIIDTFERQRQYFAENIDSHKRLIKYYKKEKAELYEYKYLILSKL